MDSSIVNETIVKHKYSGHYGVLTPDKKIMILNGYKVQGNNILEYNEGFYDIVNSPANMRFGGRSKKRKLRKSRKGKTYKKKF